MSEDIDMKKGYKMNKCDSLIGKIFGHKYIDVYDEIKGKPEILNANGCFPEEYVQLLEATKKVEKIYVYSICKRCGHVIERNGDGSSKV